MKSKGYHGDKRCKLEGSAVEITSGGTIGIRGGAIEKIAIRKEGRWTKPIQTDPILAVSSRYIDRMR